jgi:hypothetical protein
MIRWLLQPHPPWSRAQFFFLATLFAMPSFVLIGHGIAFLMPPHTFTYSPAFDILAQVRDDENYWAAWFIGVGGLHIAMMVAWLRGAWMFLLPHVGIFAFLAVPLYQARSFSSPGLFIYGCLLLQSMLICALWRHLAGK